MKPLGESCSLNSEHWDRCFHVFIVLSLMGIITFCLCRCAYGQAGQQTDLAARQMAVVRSALETYIYPTHKVLSEKTEKLDLQVKRYCLGRALPNLTRVKSAFEDTVRAFIGVSFLRFGPWVKEHRLERFLYWPDRRGRGARQIRRAVREANRKLLAPDRFVKRSVALQGLSALEYLIYELGLKDPDAAKRNGFVCEYALAITQNISNIARAVHSEWQGPQGYGVLLLHPGADNVAYQTERESVREVTRAAAVGLRVVRDQMLKPIFGNSAEEAKPGRAFLKRSGLSIVAVSVSFEHLKAYVAALQLKRFVDERLLWIKKALVEEFDHGVRIANQIDDPIERAVVEDDERRRLKRLAFTANKVHQLIVRSIVPKMGIGVGFNALDGD